MTRRTLIIAAAVAALASPLTAGDQSVEKATRFRATQVESAEPVLLPAAVNHDVTPVEASAQIEAFDASIENDSSTQIEELGGKDHFIWAQNAEQVEELGPGMLNQLNQADQIEELGGGHFGWNQNAEQVEDLGCCFAWNQ
jgi:hypothetical protein